VDGDATTYADLGGGGVMGKLQEEVPGEVFP